MILKMDEKRGMIKSAARSQFERGKHLINQDWDGKRNAVHTP
jgi:hypothetical protein